MSTPSSDVVLEARDIVKNYGGVKALKGVNFEIRKGTVTTLFGENGAGKSTLMKILSGVEQPSSGHIVLGGESVVFHGTADARDRGISIIHQELSLAPNLSVRDNIFLGREIGGLVGVDFAEQTRQTRLLLEELQLPIEPDTILADLRVGQQQIIEIARALSVDSRILIMDEPTSALAAAEVRVLFGIIEELKARGVAIVYISHHLEEALKVTDHAVVLRDGTMTAAGERQDIDLDWIVHHMVGDNYDLGVPPTGYDFGEVVLSVRDLRVLDPENSERATVDGLDLEVRQGEVVCLYGLMGSGRTELLEAIAGRGEIAGGQIWLHGERLTNESIAERIELGVGLVPEDRQRDGLVQSLSVGRNLTLASMKELLVKGFLSRGKEKVLSDRLIQDVTVKTPSADVPISSLSGGNQQKVVIGKVLATGPRVMLLDEPSRGVDVGAKGEVFRLLAGHAADGLTVVYSTSEVGECLSIAHRIIVLSRGRVAAEFGADATKEMIMAASGEAVAA